jgi:hypothetical protein
MYMSNRSCSVGRFGNYTSAALFCKAESELHFKDFKRKGPLFTGAFGQLKGRARKVRK